MNLSLPLSDFKNYVQRQINHFFPDNVSTDLNDYNGLFDLALSKTEFCFKHVKLGSYCKNGAVFLNHLHSDQYLVFLWFFSNTVWVEKQHENLASKLFYLNKALHGFNCMYDTNLPRIFLPIHILGTVLGKAEYSDFFVVTQGCTVGAHHQKYPKIGKGVAMLPNSSIIGDCKVGNRVSLGINSTVYLNDVPDDTVVYVDTNHGRLCQKPSRQAWVQHLFNVEL